MVVIIFIKEFFRHENTKEEHRGRLETTEKVKQSGRKYGIIETSKDKVIV